MPLVVIPSSQALANLGKNAEAGWPARESDKSNRLGLTANPRHRASFHITRDDRVFTVGSCFARNVEKALAARGFQVPARHAFRDEAEFATLGPNILNNYSIPSVLNELRWAFDVDRYDEETNFIEIFPGHFVDLHLNPGIGAAPRDYLERRRRAIAFAYRQLSGCDVVFFALSDAECWFDKKAGLYLNTAPSEEVMSRFPDRFEAHVLEYEDVTRLLEGLLSIVKTYGRPSARVIFTVSPSPLPHTSRMQDVMVANFYSKAVLRAALEAVVARHPLVDYFPFLEAVLHSEPSVWQDDRIHLEIHVIDNYAARMVAAYMPVEEGEATLAARLEDETDSARLFGELENRFDLLGADPGLALRFAVAAARLRRFAKARSALELVPGETPDKTWTQALVAHGEADYARVKELLAPRESMFARRRPYWSMLAMAQFETGDAETGKKTIDAWAKAFPRAAEPFRFGAVHVAKTGDPHYTRYLFNKARLLARTEDERTRVALDYAECLATWGRISLARSMAGEARPKNPHQAHRLRELELRLNIRK